MQTIRSIVSRNTYRIPPRLRLVLSRLSSLILLFQRAPIVQFLFPEANIMGGGALANSFTLAVTTVVGLGAYDAVAGATTITQKTPIDSTSIKDVPAAVGSYLNFSFLCSGAPSIVELWLTTALPAGLTHANEVNNNTDSITGIPTATGKTVVTVTAQGHDSGEQKSQAFNIYVLGFAAQPPPTQTITSGSPATLDCTVATNSYPASAAPTYQWYLGTSGTGSLITGATSRTYSPTPSTTTNYWVKITSVLSTSTVSVNSNTAVVNVTVPASVSVAVAPASVSEDGATNLVYTFTRTGATTAALTTNFAVGGSASFATDYAQSGAASFAASSGTVTIPAGSASAAVTIDPALDTAVEPNETVELTVSAGAGYTVGSPSLATGTINNDDTAYSSWASALPPGQSGPTQTPQNDGVTNLEKFAFNMDPTKPDVRMLTVGTGGTAGLPGLAMVGGKLRLEFLRRKAGTNPGITYTAQFGSNLAGWADIPVGTPAGVPIGTPADPTWERVTVDDPSGGTSRFGRVKIVQP